MAPQATVKGVRTTARQREVESDGDQFQVDQRDIAMASLTVGQMTAVQSEPFDCSSATCPKSCVCGQAL